MAGFERQFREHAEVARRRGEGHRVAVAVNGVMSRRDRGGLPRRCARRAAAPT